MVQNILERESDTAEGAAFSFVNKTTSMSSQGTLRLLAMQHATRNGPGTSGTFHGTAENPKGTQISPRTTTATRERLSVLSIIYYATQAYPTSPRKIGSHWTQGSRANPTSIIFNVVPSTSGESMFYMWLFKPPYLASTRHTSHTFKDQADSCTKDTKVVACTKTDMQRRHRGHSEERKEYAQTTLSVRVYSSNRLTRFHLTTNYSRDTNNWCFV